MSDAMDRLQKSGGGLKANQIAWCRKNIPAFDLAWRSVKAADEHKQRVYAKMDVEPGSVGVPSERTAVEEGAQS